MKLQLPFLSLIVFKTCNNFNVIDMVKIQMLRWANISYDPLIDPNDHNLI